MSTSFRAVGGPRLVPSDVDAELLMPVQATQSQPGTLPRLALSTACIIPFKPANE